MASYCKYPAIRYRNSILASKPAGGMCHSDAKLIIMCYCYCICLVKVTECVPVCVCVVYCACLNPPGSTTEYKCVYLSWSLSFSKSSN